MNSLLSKRAGTGLVYYKRAIALALFVILVLLRGPITNFAFPILAHLATPLFGLRDSLMPKREEALMTRSVAILKARIKELEADTKLDQSSLTHILSSLSVSPYGTVLIDRGTVAGSQLGDILVSTDGVALGELAEVYDNSAKVTLYSVYGRSMEVAQESGTRFLVVGSGSQNFEARLPSGMAIRAGEFLYVPGPEHYVLAKIERVESLAGAAFQRMFARSPVNINSISTAYVKSKN